MNYIVDVRDSFYGEFRVLFSGTREEVISAFHHDGRAIELHSGHRLELRNNILFNRKYRRTFEKAYVANSAMGVFIFPIYAGRFCQSKLMRFATDIAVWMQTRSSFKFSDDEAVSQALRIAENALKCKEVKYIAGVDKWGVKCSTFEKSFYSHDRIHILTGF